VRDEQARQAWRAAAAQRDSEQVVGVDASGTHSAWTRLSGWAPPDRRATGSVPRQHGKHTTLGAALTPNGRQVPWLIAGALQTATCGWSITEQLAPTLTPGHIVVRDHVRVHQAASSRQAIEARPWTLLVLPSYSPDCTPIEQACSKLNALLRRLGARTTQTFWAAIRVAVDAITPDDAIAWFAHAGDALPAQTN
jgi:DDE superfamily endonuclease